jgi:hypothetical protein
MFKYTPKITFLGETPFTHDSQKATFIHDTKRHLHTIFSDDIYTRLSIRHLHTIFNELKKRV